MSLFFRLTKATTRTSFSSVVQSHRFYGSLRSPRNFGLHFVPESTVYIVERNGLYSKTLHPGTHFLVPLLDRVTNVLVTKADQMVLWDFYAFTKDNVSLLVKSSIFYKVVDPYLATYSMVDHRYSLISLSQSLTHRLVADRIAIILVNDLWSNVVSLSQSVEVDLDKGFAQWGLRVVRFEIRVISVKHLVEFYGDNSGNVLVRFLRNQLSTFFSASGGVLYFGFGYLLKYFRDWTITDGSSGGSSGASSGSSNGGSNGV